MFNSKTRNPYVDYAFEMDTITNDIDNIPSGIDKSPSVKQ